LRELSATLEARVADRTRQLSALYDISSLAARAVNPDILLRESLVRTLPAMQCELGAIWLADEKRDQAEPARLRLVAQQGFPPTAAADQMMTPATDGLFARMAAERQPVLVTDLAADPAVPAAMAGLAAHAMLIAPLCAGEQVLGAIGLLRGAGQAFRDGERALLANIAGQLGSAVESQRLRGIAERSALLEERQRLARDLHDSVTQSLYSVTLFAQASRGSVRVGNLPLTQQYVSRLSEMAQQALKEMRWLIYELRPALVEELGLVGALQRRLDMVERRAGVEAQFTVGEIGELEAGLETAVYQIAQEALTNILKHAAATYVAVRLTADGRDLCLEIEDNGKGFDPAEKDKGAGLGLASMRERAGQLGGALAIASRPGQGTRIRLTVPHRAAHTEEAR
jgi:signal transduction histidine kinase